MEELIEFKMDTAKGLYLHPPFVTLVGAASLEAYTDFAKSSDPGYKPPNLKYGTGEFVFLKRFTGFDDVAWGSGKEERFGLIYQWTLNPDYYLIAFRGTDSIYDMVLDLESPVTTDFKPYNPGNFRGPVHVGDGFYKIYATKNASMTATMQGQIFQDIAKLSPPPKHIYVTGHSLGCALGSLFALDLAVSLPHVTMLNLNFASPRVGTGTWQNAYNTTYSLEKKTVRIRNPYDLVPKLPPEEFPFDFRHVGQEFLVAFDIENYHFDIELIIDSWHSLLNYRFVVDRAVKNSPQIWIGDFPDQVYRKWSMISKDPYTGTTELETADAKQEIELLKQMAKKQ